MTELSLYKFISENAIEWKWELNDGNKDVVMFPYHYQIEDFAALLSPTIFDEEGIHCWMKDGYFAIWMNKICQHYGIEIENVFKEDDPHP